jgi:hypothetical protein
VIFQQLATIFMIGLQIRGGCGPLLPAQAAKLVIDDAVLRQTCHLTLHVRQSLPWASAGIPIRRLSPDGEMLNPHENDACRPEGTSQPTVN